MPSTGSSGFDTKKHSVKYVHTVSEAGRLLPSASRWNSIELDFKLAPKSSSAYDSIPSQFSKSVDYDLVITDRKHFHRFIFISVSIVVLILAGALLLHFLPKKHSHQAPSTNLKLAINQALTFFDAQKSGRYPRNSTVKFRGDSGLEDGKLTDKPTDLIGGFYDSGNNIKFTFTTAYTVTLLSWTVVEYHTKYNAIGELQHVMDIIKWGSDYLLKVYVPPNSTAGSTMILYSQVGSTISKNNSDPNDINCWQKPEDMKYPRPVSACDNSASDLAGEVVAALSAASLVFKEDKEYSGKLVETAESLYEVVTKEDPKKQGKYTAVDACGKEARMFYTSSSYEDELAWGGTWLFFATKNTSYLQYVTESFKSAMKNETNVDKGVFSWDNKLNAIAVLLTRILYFQDMGFPYEDVLRQSSRFTDSLMCSFLSKNYFSKTTGGLIVLKPENGSLLQYAATASFLSKLYGDYLDHQDKSGLNCSINDAFSVDMLHNFATSQVNYILGENPLKMSYMVGYGDKFPVQVHHRSASIPWNVHFSHCDEGKRWLNSKDANPQVLLGAMVGGPDMNDNFKDERNNPIFTEPNIASNAGLVAALIALQDPPKRSSELEDPIWGWT
ncbi:hypothetical protein L6164_030384 [Bauhinia variegata]|uniref:Uncharacterized protein n=1 Tax=Bauhinia variegata TaxID=167791 RepID=A0ACB9LCL9_BAUVA|nr:hypothetical protein L6164_030384 [Bauhinia variegata]